MQSAHRSAALEQVEERVLESIDDLTRRSDGVAGRTGHGRLRHKLLGGVVDAKPGRNVVVPVERDVGRRKVEAFAGVSILDVVENGPDSDMEGSEVTQSRHVKLLAARSRRVLGRSKG